MVLMTVLIVMFMGIALLLAVYASFLPFVQNYGNMMQYTNAYYGAISAIERGVLAANLQGPGFDGESGWRWDGENQGNIGNSTDQKIDSFYNYWDPNKTSLYWIVSWSTTQIPAPWAWNVPSDFWDEKNPSKNYNTLNYNIAEAIALGTPGNVQTRNYYQKPDTNANYTTPDTQITVNLRLNPLLSERLSNNNKVLNEWVKKLPLVNWTIKGQKNGTPFSIIPTETLQWSEVNENKDTLIRGNRLNWGKTQLTFWREQNPFNWAGEVNIISQNEEKLRDKSYSNILNWTTGTNLTLDLVNLLLSPKVKAKDKWAIYPFLEYQIQSNGGKIADRFFTIQGEGRVGNYAIRLQVKKPTLDQPALWNFTIIF